jgi:hypothetical protein
MIEPNKFYMVDVDDKLVIAGSFETLEEGEDYAYARGIELLSNDNPFSIWEGQAITHYEQYVEGGFKIRAGGLVK